MSIVRELWESYATSVIPANANFIKRQETRRAFYAGAASLFYTILQILDEDREPTEEDLAKMSSIDEELRAFGEQIKSGQA